MSAREGMQHASDFERISARAAEETRARLIAETRAQTARLIADTRKQTLAEVREKALAAELRAKELVAERAFGYGDARIAYVNRPYYAAPAVVRAAAVAPIVYSNGVSGLTYAVAASPARRTVVIQEQPQSQPVVVAQARRAPRVVVV